MTSSTHFAPADRRAIVLSGVPGDVSYTFSVRGYRRVARTVDPSGVILSPPVASQPYKPFDVPVFAGDISGTIQGRDSLLVVQNIEAVVSDAILSKAEKPAQILAYNQVVVDLNAMLTASDGNPAVETQRNAALAAKSSLGAYLEALDPPFTNTAEDTAIDPAAYSAAWAAAHTALADLRRAVAEHVVYPDKTPIADLKPAEGGATAGATVGDGTTAGNIKDKNGNPLTEADLVTSEGTARNVQFIGGFTAVEFERKVLEAEQQIVELIANGGVGGPDFSQALADIEAYKLAAEAARDAAQSAQDNAQASARDADDKAIAASGSAQTAATKADEAASSASAASASSVAAQTEAGKASISATSAASSATTAAGHSTSAQTSASVAADSRKKASQAAALQFPQALDPSTFNATLPALFAPANVNGLDDDGKSSWISADRSSITPPVGHPQLGLNGVAPYEAGRKYRFVADVECLSTGGEADIGIWFFARYMSASYTAAGNANVPPAGSNRLTAGQRATLTSELTLPAATAISWLRPGILLNRKSSSIATTISGAQCRVYSFWIEDITESATAKGHAAAAATSASTATTHAAGAASSAAAATNSLVIAEQAASNATYLDVGQVFDFDAGASHYFIAWHLTATPGLGGLHLVGTGVDPQLYRLGLSINGARYTRVLVEVTRLTERREGFWDGSLLWGSDNHGFDGNHFAKTSFDPPVGVRSTLTFEMTTARGGAEWLANTVHSLRLDLDHGAQTEWKIHSIRIVGADGAAPANAASIATAQAAVATAAAAAASSATTLTASVGGSSAINRNVGFDDYPSAAVGALPTHWEAWEGSGGIYRVSDGQGGYAVRIPSNAGAHAGIANRANGQQFLTTGGFYVLDVEVTLNAGSFAGAGVLMFAWNPAVQAVERFSMPFALTPSTTSEVSSGVVGRTYTFNKLIRVTAADAKGYDIYAHAHFNGHGSIAAANDITFKRVVLRPATEYEIQAGITVPNLYSSVSTHSSVLATHTERLASWFTRVSSGVGTAEVKLTALDSNGNSASSIGLTADRISLGSISTPVLQIQNGAAVFTGELNVGGTSGARLKITKNLIELFDANGTRRARIGIW